MEFIKKLNDDYLIENHIKKINNKKFPELSLFKYSKDKSNFETVDVRQARGIILNKENNIICYSLNKFNNRENKDHKYFDSIWKECIIEEAIEGTQIRLYYYNNEWQVTTARTILAENSKWDYIKSFQQLFNDVSTHIDYNLLNKDYTYTFILKHIENRIISNIKKNELIHIHTRNNKTCDELNVDINIKKPTVYHFNNYEDLINVAVSDKLYNIEFPNRDATFLRNGFVLSQLDGEGMRAMQLQEEQAMKESLKNHLLKQTSQETGVNI